MRYGMIPLNDPAITRGMNTVDDANVLKDGEAVRLLNAFPGNPPAIIRGSTSVILNNSNGYRFVPDGISMAFGGTNYIFVCTIVNIRHFNNKPIFVFKYKFYNFVCF